ncbi:SrfA family protein, partial [Enterobacter ludwigii]
ADEPLIAPATVVRITPDELYTPEPAPVIVPPVEEPEPEPAIVAKKRRVPLWTLPVAAVIVAAIATPLLWPKQAPSAEPVAVVAPEPVAIAPKPIKAVEPLPMKLPLHQAEVVASKEKEPAPVATPAPAPVVIAAIPKDAMVMEANQVKAGSTRFLNGTWRAILDVKDPITGKPPSLRYQIQNNKGFARVVHGDNVVCRVEVFSGLHSNGELMIKSRGNARCTDGSRYPMPEVACKAGTSDVAECNARYDAKTVVPLTFKKAGA